MRRKLPTFVSFAFLGSLVGCGNNVNRVTGNKVVVRDDEMEKVTFVKEYSWDSKNSILQIAKESLSHASSAKYTAYYYEFNDNHEWEEEREDETMFYGGSSVDFAVSNYKNTTRCNYGGVWQRETSYNSETTSAFVDRVALYRTIYRNGASDEEINHRGYDCSSSADFVLDAGRLSGWWNSITSFTIGEDKGGKLYAAYYKESIDPNEVYNKEGEKVFGFTRSVEYNLICLNTRNNPHIVSCTFFSKTERNYSSDRILENEYHTAVKAVEKYSLSYDRLPSSNKSNFLESFPAEVISSVYLRFVSSSSYSEKGLSLTKDGDHYSGRISLSADPSNSYQASYSVNLTSYKNGQNYEISSYSIGEDLHFSLADSVDGVIDFLSNTFVLYKSAELSFTIKANYRSDGSFDGLSVLSVSVSVL